MKIQTYSRFILIATLLLSSGNPRVSAQNQTNVLQINPEYAAFLTNAPPPGFATRLDYVWSFKNEKEILNAYRSGLLNDVETELAFEALRDKSSMDFYGKVEDQNSNSIAGVQVDGHLGNVVDGYTKQKTVTDSQGRFQYVGLQGSYLVMHFHKPGYEFNENLLPERPKNYLPNPDKPLIITMWKLHGPEPMWHADTKGLPYSYSFLQPNGSPARINMRTCRDDKYVSERNARDERHYDLEMALHLDEPIKTNANRVLFCNWSATISITNGGLVEIPTTDIYPYEAPADGYQSSLTLNFPTNMTGWLDHFKKSFYFKSAAGKTYGRMMMQMNNCGRLALEIYANPNGSRNLEFDPQKQIR